MDEDGWKVERNTGLTRQIHVSDEFLSNRILLSEASQKVWKKDAMSLLVLTTLQVNMFLIILDLQ